MFAIMITKSLYFSAEVSSENKTRNSNTHILQFSNVQISGFSIYSNWKVYFFRRQDISLNFVKCALKSTRYRYWKWPRMATNTSWSSLFNTKTFIYLIVNFIFLLKTKFFIVAFLTRSWSVKFVSSKIVPIYNQQLILILNTKSWQKVIRTSEPD